MQYRIKTCLSVEEQVRLVHKADRDMDETIEDKANFIASLKGLKFLGLTGPTCSGKTTAAKKLTESLWKNGYRVFVISLDDFFKETVDYRTEKMPDDPDFQIDYDSEEAMDIDLLRTVVDSIRAEKPFRLPKFNFRNGKRIESDREINVPKDSVFIFEGIQLLYPKIREIFTEETFRILYIAPMTEIVYDDLIFSPTEIRLMRRIVRDFRHRDSPPSFTFLLWQSVRANEDMSIFPFLDFCDDKIDSSLPYEIGVLQPHLLPLLEAYPKNDPFFEDAEKLYRKILNVQPISSEYLLENSLYKEFI